MGRDGTPQWSTLPRFRCTGHPPPKFPSSNSEALVVYPNPHFCNIRQRQWVSQRLKSKPYLQNLTITQPPYPTITNTPNSRARISNDPQNTTWANNTTRFGHRILTSQGWTPGATLGAKDASHSTHYTAASASHIRVLLKEDNLGLGAKRGSERAENFGLAGLDAVLGRLNGREEDVKREEERRVEVERKGSVVRRLGFMNFVSGGFLVGDKIEKGVKVKREVKIEVKEEDVKVKVEEVEEAVVERKKEKKRKRDRVEEDVKEEGADDQPKLKRKKKSMNLRDEAKAQDSETSQSQPKSKKDKKKKIKSSDSPSITTTSTSVSETPAVPAEPLSDKAKRKAERRAKKEEKKLKKALKKAAKEAALANTANEATSDSSSSEDEDSETPKTSSVPTTGTSTPILRGHQLVRQRYIMQKKRASMDPQALKEVSFSSQRWRMICMLTSSRYS